MRDDARRPVFLLFLSLALAAPGWSQESSPIRNGGFDRDVAGWSFRFSPGSGVGRAEWAARDAGMWYNRRAPLPPPPAGA